MCKFNRNFYIECEVANMVTSKIYRMAFHMTAKGGRISRVGGSGSEGDTGTVGNSGNTSLFRCQSNVAKSP
jgi:hypothetical protein